MPAAPPQLQLKFGQRRNAKGTLPPSFPSFPAGAGRPAQGPDQPVAQVAHRLQPAHPRRKAVARTPAAPGSGRGRRRRRLCLPPRAHAGTEIANARLLWALFRAVCPRVRVACVCHGSRCCRSCGSACRPTNQPGGNEPICSSCRPLNAAASGLSSSSPCTADGWRLAKVCESGRRKASDGSISGHV